LPDSVLLRAFAPKLRMPNPVRCARVLRSMVIGVDISFVIARTAVLNAGPRTPYRRHLKSRPVHCGIDVLRDSLLPTGHLASPPPFRYRGDPDRCKVGAVTILAVNGSRDSGVLTQSQRRARIRVALKSLVDVA